MFEYSPVDGAKANELPNHVSTKVMAERKARFMAVQAEISMARLQQKIGKTLDILIDEVDEEGAIGRSKADAPEIDGLVYLNGETQHQVGAVIQAKITHADEHDLWGSTD